MTKKRTATTGDFIEPRPRKIPATDGEEEVELIPELDLPFREEGVPGESESTGSGQTDDGSAARRRARRREAVLVKEQLMDELRAARERFDAVTEELTRIKRSTATDPATVPTPLNPGNAANVSMFENPGGPQARGRVSTSQPTDTEKDANRRALLARCSEEFRRRDPLKQPPIPHPFTGAAGQDLDEFLLRFEVRANNCNWTEADKVMGLAYHLDKSAALAYQRMIANGDLANASFGDAVTKLRTMFPQAAMADEQAVAVFMAMRQRSSESVTEYSERFQTTLARAERYQGSLTPTAVFNRFCSSLRRELRDAMRTTKVEDMGDHPLQGAIAMAMRIEARILQEDGQESDDSGDLGTKARTGKRKRPTTEEPGDQHDYWPQTAKRTVRAVAAEEPKAQEPSSGADKPEENTLVLRQVKALLDTTQAIATRMQETQSRDAMDKVRGFTTNAFPSAYHSQGNEFPPFRPRSPPPLKPAPVTCYNCGKQGHRAFECTARRLQRPYGNRQFQPKQPPRDRQGHDGPGRFQPRQFPAHGQQPQRQDREGPQREGVPDQRRDRQLSEDDRQALARTAALLRAAGMVVGDPLAPPAPRPAEAQRPN